VNFTQEEGFELRCSKESEITYLREWIMGEEAMMWLPVSTEEDASCVAKNWIAFARFSASLTAFYQEKPIGIATLILMPYRKVAHHAMVYFVIDPEFRRKGVGSHLMRRLHQVAKDKFSLEKVVAELFEGCPAIHFLEQLGYQEVVRQEKFVKEGQRYLSRLILEYSLLQM